MGLNRRALFFFLWPEVQWWSATILKSTWKNPWTIKDTFRACGASWANCLWTNRLWSSKLSSGYRGLSFVWPCKVQPFHISEENKRHQVVWIGFDCGVNFSFLGLRTSFVVWQVWWKKIWFWVSSATFGSSWARAVVTGNLFTDLEGITQSHATWNFLKKFFNNINEAGEFWFKDNWIYKPKSFLLGNHFTIMDLVFHFC